MSVSKESVCVCVRVCVCVCVCVRVCVCVCVNHPSHPFHPSQADELKNKGNEAFSAKDFDKAIGFFTEAIELDPTNHVLFSNRSASFASQGKFKQALADAEKTVGLKSDWAKGYSRKGAALQGLGDHYAAREAYEQVCVCVCVCVCCVCVLLNRACS